MFRHPKYYKELRKLRNKLAESRQPVVGGQQQSDQAISDHASTEVPSVRPGPGLSGKQQAASDERQATSEGKLQATSSKRQASE